MVDFKSKIKAQKSKDRKRAGKRSKPVSGDRLSSPPKAKLPSARKSANNSAAILKSVASLFKDKDKDEIILDIGNEDPGIAGVYDMPGVYDFDLNPMSGYKKGGRLKKAGKRKRAALRGQRSELRGS